MIGVFDSGFGGLTVLNSLHENLPEYQYLYYGDNKNAPYGNKNKDEIYKLTKSALDFMFSKGAILIIVACNTVSVEVLRKIQNFYKHKTNKKRILGVVVPNLEYIEINKDISRLGIIGTSKTIDSLKYEKELKIRRPDLKVYSNACPKFVNYIEADQHKTDEALANIKKELIFIKKKSIKHLLLACTHYSIIKNEIKNNIPKETHIIDSVDIISNQTKAYINNHPELMLDKKNTTMFYSSMDIKNFKTMANKILIKKEKRKFIF